MLPTQSASARRITRHFFWQKLQSNAATQFQVLRLVHHSHATATEDFQHSVVGNLLANQILRTAGYISIGLTASDGGFEGARLLPAAPAPANGSRAALESQCTGDCRRSRRAPVAIV